MQVSILYEIAHLTLFTFSPSHRRLLFVVPQTWLGPVAYLALNDGNAMVYSHMPGRPFTAKAMEPLYICGTVDEPVYDRQVRQRLWEFCLWEIW
jgi:hypothetical protein